MIILNSLIIISLNIYIYYISNIIIKKINLKFHKTFFFSVNYTVFIKNNLINYIYFLNK